jgi:hypothetical protein
MQMLFVLYPFSWALLIRQIVLERNLSLQLLSGRIIVLKGLLVRFHLKVD